MTISEGRQPNSAGPPSLAHRPSVVPGSRILPPTYWLGDLSSLIPLGLSYPFCKMEIIWWLLGSRS